VLPVGLADLVKIVLEDWDWDQLPSSTEEIWDALLYPLFLGANTRSAQAAYAKRMLGDMIEFKVAQSIPTDRSWSKKALAIVDMQLGGIKGTAGEGLKRAILNATRQEIEGFKLSRTIGDALLFFDKEKLDVAKITSLRNNKLATKELVDRLAHSVFDVRYIKGVLWLYSCGIAKDLVPPNSHVLKFLDECGYPGFAYSRDNPREDWDIFAPACNCMEDVAKQVSIELHQSVTPKQAQFAVWYLQTSRGLVDYRKKQLTPRLLIEFLDFESISFDELRDRLEDIEALGQLANDLNAFLKAS
jgi:hypothetical protein